MQCQVIAKSTKKQCKRKAELNSKYCSQHKQIYEEKEVQILNQDLNRQIKILTNLI